MDEIFVESTSKLARKFFHFREFRFNENFVGNPMNNPILEQEYLLSIKKISLSSKKTI